MTLAIGGVLAAGAVGAQSLVQENRLVSELNKAMGHLALARTEAIKRGTRVVVCPSADLDACAAPSGEHTWWHGGYMVFADEDGDREKDPFEPVIYSQPATGGDLVIHSSDDRRKIVYQPDGTVTGNSNLTLTFCDARGSARARAILVLGTGRARIGSRKSDGQPLVCPRPS